MPGKKEEQWRLSESYQDVRVGVGTRKEERDAVCRPRVTGDMTWSGTSFQMLGPATGNARLPTLDRRTGGTSRR